MSVLLCFSGLPGVGKTSIAKELAQETGALWLWIDEIETRMRQSHMHCDDLADGGYAAAQAVAERALRQGYSVIADCVNPITLTRQAWRKVSRDAGAAHLDVEIRCPDKRRHRACIENRVVDLQGWSGPSWQEVEDREYEEFSTPVLTIDTAKVDLKSAVSELKLAMETRLQGG